MATPLTAADLAYLHSEYDGLNELVAQAAYDRLGNVGEVLLELIRTKLAAAIAGPDFNLSGVYSESKAAQIQALQAQLNRVANAAGLAGTTGSVLERATIRSRHRRTPGP